MIIDKWFVHECSNCNEIMSIPEMRNHLCKGKKLTVAKFIRDGKVEKIVYKEHHTYDTIQKELFPNGGSFLFTLEYHE